MVEIPLAAAAATRFAVPAFFPFLASLCRVSPAAAQTPPPVTAATSGAAAEPLCAAGGSAVAPVSTALKFEDNLPLLILVPKKYSFITGTIFNFSQT
jgi:hypothetical protein